MLVVHLLGPKRQNWPCTCQELGCPFLTQTSGLPLFPGNRAVADVTNQRLAACHCDKPAAYPVPCMPQRMARDSPTCQDECIDSVVQRLKHSAHHAEMTTKDICDVISQVVVDYDQFALHVYVVG